jgi:hypothetical protein
MASLDKVLRNAMVAEAICKVDRSEAKYIDNPYGSLASVTMAAIGGTYSVGSYTLTDDTLTVTDEIIVAEHIYNHEQVLSAFDVWANRIDEQNYAVAYELDKWVLNNLCEDGTGTYTTPPGGFTTAANIPTILSNIASKFQGYADSYKGLYVVLENTDTPGLMTYQASSGFNMADSALKNGMMGHYMGFDIYVVRSGTFVDDTLGSTAVTNSGHRVAGVKGVATYAAPRGIEYEELLVSGHTGKEIRTYALCGFKQWATKSDLTVDIELA